MFRALHGFLTRQQTEEYLNKSPNGTFLIRFSDSEPGGVTIAWITGKNTTLNIISYKSLLDEILLYLLIIRLCMSIVQ